MAEPKADLKITDIEFLVTVDAERRVIRDGAVVIDGGRFTHVDTTAALADHEAERVIDGRRTVATPGFLNGHLHISYAHAVRGIFPDDVENRLAQVFLMQRAMTGTEERATTLLGVIEALTTGTTAFVDPGTTQFPDEVLDVYEMAGCRVFTGEHVVDRGNPVNLPVSDTAAAIACMEESFEVRHRQLDGRMQTWTMPFSLEVCSTELLVAAKGLADRHATMMTIHHGGAMGRDGPTPTARLADIGVLGPNVVLSHCMGLDDDEIALIAEAGASVVMCPSTVVKSGGGIAANGRLPELLGAGVPVALGTDSVNSSNFIDLVRSMHLAATVYKDARSDTSLIQPETALELATRTGAAALGAGDELGAIEVGRRADLVLFDATRPQWRGLTDPVRNLVFSATGDSVDTVIVDGRVVVEDKRPTFIDDLWPLISEVEAAGTRIRSATGIDHPSAWPAS